jgi:hypothetical protein
VQPIVGRLYDLGGILVVCFAMFADCLAAIDLGRGGVRAGVTLLTRLDQFLLGQLEALRRTIACVGQRSLGGINSPVPSAAADRRRFARRCGLPSLSAGFPLFLSGLYGCSCRDSSVGSWAWTWSSFCLSF